MCTVLQDGFTVFPVEILENVMPKNVSLPSSLQLLPWKKPSFPFDALTKENWMVIRDFDVIVNPPTLSEFEELAKSLANANNVPTTIWNKANRLNCILMFQNVLARLLQAKPNLLDSTTDLNLIIFKSGLFKLPTETMTSSSEAAGLSLHNSEGAKKLSTISVE